MNFESQPEHSGNSFLRKKFKELPVFFPTDYKNSNALGAVRVYKLNVGQRIFMTFKDQRGSKLGMLIRVLTKVAIIANAAAYVWSWSPVNMRTSSTCDKPVCENDPLLCPGATICEPTMDVTMLKVQITCMLVLLANFTIPTLFCWSVPARLAGVLDLTLELHMADEAASKGDNEEEEAEGATSRKRSGSAAARFLGVSNGMSALSIAEISKIEGDLGDDPQYPVLMQMCRYCTTGRSLRAIVGNVPLFLVFLTVTDLTSSGLVVYIARMTTLLQLVDFISGKKSGQVTRRTLGRAYPTMLFMIWCIFLLAVFVGSVAFLLERGEFTVTEEYPQGAFLRPTVTGRGKEESPFTSMALSLYWVVVTVTSVGYGELVCTSAYGRLISVMLMVMSIFVLALPIAVIGQILTEEMEKYVERKAQKETRVAQQIGVDKSSDLLKKYSSTIERRKSQFNFDLPNELKVATAKIDKRKAMMVKMASANDVLMRKPPPLLEERSVSMSGPASTAAAGKNGERSSASKLFTSWGDEEDEGEDEDEQMQDSKYDDNDKEEDDDDGVEGLCVVVGVKGRERAQGAFVLGASPTSPVALNGGSPRKYNKVRSKAEVKWDDMASERDGGQVEIIPLPPTDTPPPLPAASPSGQLHRKSPMLRPATAKKIGSESSILKSTKMTSSIGSSSSASSRGVLTRSPSTRIRDIDRELRLLESSYMRQMQQCSDLHNQIVALMKEKNVCIEKEALL